MTLVVLLWSYGILKVVHPTVTEPLYVFYDPKCSLRNGAITVVVENLMPPDPLDRVGTLKQGSTTCDVQELVYPGI